MSEQVEVFGVTDIGCVRKENQDSFLIFQPDDPELRLRRGVLVILADGMGGLEGGKVASTLAVETVRDSYYACRGDVRLSLETAVKEANSAIFRRSQELGTGKQMGSTITALVALGDTAFIAHVGDSRCYRVRDNELRQVTRDHSLVRELLDRGEIEKDSPQYSFHRNILTRGLGLNEDVAVDAMEVVGVEPGDVFLMSSDGLHEQVAEDEIIDALASSGENLEAAAAFLVERARERGGPDNITVTMLRYPSSGRRVPTREHPERLASSVSGLRAALLPALAFLCFCAGVLLTLWITSQDGATVERRAKLQSEAARLVDDLERDLTPAARLNAARELRNVLHELDIQGVSTSK